jgi:hypothetical protein
MVLLLAVRFCNSRLFIAELYRKFKVFMRDIQKDKRLRTNFGFGKLSRSPSEFDSIISICANEFGVDKSLVKAVIQVESGFNPRAYSRSRASGLWQFIRETARRYGLDVNRAVDERNDPVKATAAIDGWRTSRTPSRPHRPRTARK